MPGYPASLFRQGTVDQPFGGQPANRFGAPQRSFLDDQVRALQQQVQDDQWIGGKILRLPIYTGGNVGDAVVFDASQALGPGKWPFRKLATGGFTQDVTIMVGVMIDGVSTNGVARVVFQGVIAPQFTGLAATSGRLTIDTSTGRLRLAAVGEPTWGFADASGNAFVWIPGLNQ